MKEEPKPGELNIRYQKNPMHLFFEYYILDTIEELPAEQRAHIQSLKLDVLFDMKDKHWKQVVKDVLQFSDTLDIAIMDLWMRNHKITSEQGLVYDPRKYAMDFVNNFYKEGSKIDVWSGNELMEAKERIQQFFK